MGATVDVLDEPLVPQPRELTAEEARALFDEHARAEVGMSGPEFLRRWDAGELGRGR